MAGIPRQVAAWSRVIILVALGLMSSACSLLNAPQSSQPAVYSGPPTVSIASPRPNVTYEEGVGVNILVRVENAGPDIASVSIEVDGRIIGEAAMPNPGGAPGFTVRNGWPASGTGQHTITVVAVRQDGTMSDPASVTFNVVAAAASPTSDSGDEDTSPLPTPVVTAQGLQTQPTTAPTPVPEDTNTPEPTSPPQPTSTPTPSQPQVRVVQGANVRSGPSTAFNPPIGSLAAGAVEDLLAVNPERTWYKIRYYNGEGWIFGITVEVIGDSDSIPVEQGPPTPIPFTPTPVPTNTPVAVADLSITDSSTGPFPLECGRASDISVTVSNSGSGNSSATTVVVEDLYNGQVIESTSAPVRGLAPGESVTLNLALTVSTYVFEGHVHRIRVDPENQVAETNESNNADEYAYVLAAGRC